MIIFKFRKIVSNLREAYFRLDRESGKAFELLHERVGKSFKSTMLATGTLR